MRVRTVPKYPNTTTFSHRTFLYQLDGMQGFFLLSISVHAEPQANFADSRATSRSSAVEEQNADRDGYDSADDAYLTGEGLAKDHFTLRLDMDEAEGISRDDTSRGPQPLRGAGSDGQQANTPAGRTVETNDPPRRKRGRLRKKILVDDDNDNSAQRLTGSRMRGGMAAMISSEHLDSFPFNSNFDLNKALDEEGTESTRASTGERLIETPERSIVRSEESTAERRSVRAKALPQGFFRQHLPKSQFENTMWDVFKDD